MANVRDLSTDFTHQKTAKRQLAVLIALSLTSGAAFAAAEQTINVTANAGNAPQESAWGPAPTIAAKHSATGTKTDTPIEKNPQSVSVVTSQEMQMRQVQSVKKPLPIPRELWWATVARLM